MAERKTYPYENSKDTAPQKLKKPRTRLAIRRQNEQGLTIEEITNRNTLAYIISNRERENWGNSS